MGSHKGTLVFKQNEGSFVESRGFITVQSTSPLVYNKKSFNRASAEACSASGISRPGVIHSTPLR